MIIFHNPGNSIWPFFIGSSTSLFAISFIWFLNGGSFIFFAIAGFVLVCFVSRWWEDVVRESLYLGGHTLEIQSCFKFCMVLFIFSECMFFFSFFWAFFHSALSPSPSIGLVWPPVGVFPLDPFSTPLLNTCILLSSGLTVTVSHYKLILYDMSSGMYLFMTIFLGYLFTRFQYFEYKMASFTFADSIYGSCFYMATGFHGIHVLVGTIFLFVCFIRLGPNIDAKPFYEYSSTHHVSFELAIWYWHFVDVVWLFLFITIYLWGS